MPQKKAKRKERPWRILEPQEWLKRYSDWRKCQPGSPKRQAYEIIRILSRQQQALGAWTARIAAEGSRGRVAREQKAHAATTGELV